VDRYGAYGAYSDTTGAQLWTSNLGPHAWVDFAVADAHGRLHLVVRPPAGTSPMPKRTLVTVDQATGSTLRTQGINGYLTSLVPGARDNLSFDTREADLPPFGAPPDAGPVPGDASRYPLVSLSGTGAVRWVRPLAYADAPVSVHNGELLLLSGELRAT